MNAGSIYLENKYSEIPANNQTTYLSICFSSTLYLPYLRMYYHLQYPNGAPCEYDPLFLVKDYKLPRFPVSDRVTHQHSC